MASVSCSSVDTGTEMLKGLMAQAVEDMSPFPRCRLKLFERDGKLFLELCMRYSPSNGSEGPQFLGSRAWQARELWEDVLVLANQLGGNFPWLVGQAAAAGALGVDGLPATLVDQLADMYQPGANHPQLEVRLLEAIEEPATGNMAARIFLDRRATNVNGVKIETTGAQMWADATARAANPAAYTVHIWPDASRMVRPLHGACDGSARRLTRARAQACADLAVYVAQLHFDIMVCDLAGAQRAGYMPPGWIVGGLFIAPTDAARLAVSLHVMSSCVVQRAVAYVSRTAHTYLEGDY